MNNLFFISSKSCPFAHRIEIVINLLQLEHIVKVIWCDPEFRFTGWKLDYDYTGSNAKQVFQIDTLPELYKIANPEYVGRYTLPVLYDMEQKKIISNESSEILSILNNYDNRIILNPVRLQDVIKVFCDEFGTEICTNTYRAGHAKTQQEYIDLSNGVFNYLEKLDENLAKKDYILSTDTITLADIYAFAHLIRFDCVFYDLFKLNKKHLWEFENIRMYLSKLLKNNAFASTVDLDEIKKGAFLSENNRPENMGCLKVPHGNGGFEKYYGDTPVPF